MLGYFPLVVWAQAYNFWWLCILAGVLIGAVCYMYFYRNKQARMLDKMGKLLKNFSITRNYIKAGLASCAIISMFLALLHPQWGRVTDQVEQHGRDLIIALDISRSMLVQDVQPDRLACAKNIVTQLMQALETDRIALMVFSEKARVYCPLTKDTELVSRFLDQIDHMTLSSGTTLLDQPITCAIDQCNRQPQRKNNVLVLISDGEDFSGSLAGIKERAAACGLTILVVGVGTMQGAPIPVYNEKKERVGYLKDTHDRVVISQLNKKSLQQLAKSTSGLAVFLEKDKVNIDELVARIKQFEKERQETATVTSLKEQYPWFLLVSFICLLLEWVL